LCPSPVPSQPVVQFALGGGPSFARLKVSRTLVVGKLTGALGEAEDDGERDALGLSEGETDELGDTLGEVDDEGEMLELGLGESEIELDGLRLALGLSDALGLLVLNVSVSARMRLGLFAVVTPSEIAKSLAESEPMLIEPLCVFVPAGSPLRPTSMTMRSPATVV
jgi:hypothetical protein